MNASFQNIKTQIVELAVLTPNSTLLRFNFDTQNFLRQKNIVSIESFTANDITLSPTGNILPSTANAQAAFLTLYGSDPESEGSKGDWLQRIPYLSMHRMNNGVDPYVFDLFTLVPRNIVWEKSFIDTSALLANASPLSFLLNVGYTGTAGD